jgi:hypothetical protein
VIVDDFHVYGTLGSPDKTDSPPLIDAYAVLSFSIILERFKPVAGRHLQIVKNC